MSISRAQATWAIAVKCPVRDPFGLSLFRASSQYFVLGCGRDVVAFLNQSDHPPSTKRRTSTSPTTKTAGSSSSPDRV